MAGDFIHLCDQSVLGQRLITACNVTGGVINLKSDVLIIIKVCLKGVRLYFKLYFYRTVVYYDGVDEDVLLPLPFVWDSSDYRLWVMHTTTEAP